jgi:glycosyltransferase involved in cell wall biosynthesis
LEFGLKSISVVIPTYNRQHTLARAIDSVLDQTSAVDEIIVVDDGSTDQTRNFLSEKYPSVDYYYQSNAGVSAARNKGVLAAKSDWIAFLDSDDQWLEKKISMQRQAWNDSPAHRIVHSDEIWIRNGVRVNKKNKYAKSGGRIFKDCLAICAISPSSVVLEKKLFGEMKGFDESLIVCEDYDLWLKICSKYPVLLVDVELLRKYGGDKDQLSTIHWGLDRFRVTALNRLLNSIYATMLSPQESDHAKTVLREKCTILANGASKRGNQHAAGYYQSLLM